jgi:hypothetical protein
VQSINGLLRGIAFIGEQEPFALRKRAKKIEMAAAGSSAAGRRTKRPALGRPFRGSDA